MGIAAALAALGNTDLAFDFLFQSLENGEPEIFTLRSDLVWDDLQPDSQIGPTRRRILDRFRSIQCLEHTRVAILAHVVPIKDPTVHSDVHTRR